MQTFLPYSDFTKTAQALDRMRLGKQRVETLQIMSALVGLRVEASALKGRDRTPLPEAQWTVEPLLTTGWSRHPAVEMWRGYELKLLEYQEAICSEWVARGYRDSCLKKTLMLVEAAGVQREAPVSPPWLGDERLHLSHQANLLRKELELSSEKAKRLGLESDHYLKLFGELDPTLPYVWPSAVLDKT